MSELKVNTIAAADAGQNLVLRGGDSDGVMPAGAVTFTGAVTLPAGSVIATPDSDSDAPIPLGGGGGGGGGFTLGTPHTFPNSGSLSHDFTGIPAGVTQIIFSFASLSAENSNNFLVQMAGSDNNFISTETYQSGAGFFINNAGPTTQPPSVNSASIGFIMRGGSEPQGIHGSMTMNLINRETNLWASNHTTVRYGNAVGGVGFGGGRKVFPQEITQLRVTVDTSGQQLIDGGTVNVSYQ